MALHYRSPVDGNGPLNLAAGRETRIKLLASSLRAATNDASRHYRALAGIQLRLC
ncbi:hypothetical protein ABIB90_008460 [Bradyrhizobium sp. JR4.1]